MAEVHIVDIDGEQWDIKDQPLTTRVAALEEKATKNFEYSTTEQKIGKWVDGRDLYRLIVTGSTTTRYVEIGLTDKNIKNITKISGVCNANREYYFPIPYYLFDESGSPTSFFSYSFYSVMGSVLSLKLGEASYFDNVSFNIEIEYTKNS